MRRLVATALLLCLSLLSVPMASAETFRFTAIPDEDQSRLVERFQKVADYLADELGVEVEYVPVKSYSAAVSACGFALLWLRIKPEFRRTFYARKTIRQHVAYLWKTCTMVNVAKYGPGRNDARARTLAEVFRRHALSPGGKETSPETLKG